jgi:hypothetical protein
MNALSIASTFSNIMFRQGLIFNSATGSKLSRVFCRLIRESSISGNRKETKEVTQTI